MPIACTCAKCGRNFRAPDAAAGKRVKCPGCAAPVEVAAAPEDEDDGGTYLAADDSQKCPKCRHELPKDAVLCVNCGLNLQTGKKLKTIHKAKTRRVILGGALCPTVTVSRTREGDLQLTVAKWLFGIIPCGEFTVNLKKYDTVLVDCTLGRRGFYGFGLLGFLLTGGARPDVFYVSIRGNRVRPLQLYRGTSDVTMKELLDMLQEVGLRVERK